MTSHGDVRSGGLMLGWVRCGMETPQISATYEDSRGSFNYVIAPQLGLCTGCGNETSIFINRDGKTLCVSCDLEEGKRIAGRKLRGVSA